MLDLEYLTGLTVGRIILGSDGVTLDLWDKASAYDPIARLDAGPLRYESASGSIINLGPAVEVGTQYAPLLALYRCEIKTARLDEEANALELVFETGDKFTALPMPGVEGWQLVGPGERFVVAVPGDSVATWK